MTDQEVLALYSDTTTRERSLRELIRMHQRPIYYYIRRMVLDHDDADDLTQSTFIKAWKNLGDFRGESKLSTWLHSIAYRECLAFLRQRNRICRVPLEDAQHALPAALEADVLYTGDEIQRMLQAAVAALPEKQKAVFIMKYYDEMKYEEMATITGTSVGALKASFHHAVQKIESAMKKLPH